MLHSLSPEHTTTHPSNYHCSMSNFLEFVTLSIWLVLVISYWCFTLKSAEKCVFVFITENHSHHTPIQPEFFSTHLNAGWFIKTADWYWQLYSHCVFIRLGICVKYWKCKLQVLIPLNQHRETWNTGLTFPGLHKEPTNLYNSVVI
jgi:hypothetical protein